MEILCITFLIFFEFTQYLEQFRTRLAKPSLEVGCDDSFEFHARLILFRKFSRHFYRLVCYSRVVKHVTFVLCDIGCAERKRKNEIDVFSWHSN